jgi:hypothetical protein
MPYAIERLLAMPTISAFLPARNPIINPEVEKLLEISIASNFLAEHAVSVLFDRCKAEMS